MTRYRPLGRGTSTPFGVKVWRDVVGGGHDLPWSPKGWLDTTVRDEPDDDETTNDRSELGGGTYARRCGHYGMLVDEYCA